FPSLSAPFAKGSGGAKREKVTPRAGRPALGKGAVRISRRHQPTSTTIRRCPSPPAPLPARPPPPPGEGGEAPTRRFAPSWIHPAQLIARRFISGRRSGRLMRSTALSLFLFALLAAGCRGEHRGTGAARHHGLSGAARGWNVLLLSVDTLRADHLGAYGYR